MRIVVADTGPLHYLILIEAVEILPRLFETVFLPEAVYAELTHSETPIEVRQWMMVPPKWLVIDSAPADMAPRLKIANLDIGEREALALAVSLKADLILMDDRAGVIAARDEGFAVMGTLGVLDLAARHGLIDLASSFVQLRATSFRCRPEIMDELFVRYEADK